MTPSPSSFSWEPLFLALVVAAAVAYAHAARVDRPSRARVTVFALGLTLVVAALCSPLETIARHYLLLFHLLGNVMIADWAPPLLVLGLTPARRVAIAARVAPLMRPWLTLGVWLVIWYLVHLPAFYDYALRHEWALGFENAPRLWGFSAAKDQNLGGILMNVEQTLVFLAALAYFLIRLLDEEQEQHNADEQKQGASPRPVSLSSDRPR